MSGRRTILIQQTTTRRCREYTLRSTWKFQAPNEQCLVLECMEDCLWQHQTLWNRAMATQILQSRRKTVQNEWNENSFDITSTTLTLIEVWTLLNTPLRPALTWVHVAGTWWVDTISVWTVWPHSGSVPIRTQPGSRPIRTVFLVWHAPFLRKSSVGGQTFVTATSCMTFSWFEFVRRPIQCHITCTALANCPHYNIEVNQHLLRVHQRACVPATSVLCVHKKRLAPLLHAPHNSLYYVPTFKSIACFRALEESFIFDTFKALFAFFRPCG